MFRRRPDPFADLSFDAQYQEPEEHGSFLHAVVRSEGGFLETASNAERQANRSARAHRRQAAGEYVSPFRQEEHQEDAQRRKMKRYPTVSANSAFAKVHPRELGFRTFGHETKRAKDISFPVYLRDNETRQEELLRQVQVREARLDHVKNSQILYDYTEEGKRKRAIAAANAKAKAKGKDKAKGKAKAKGETKEKNKTKSKSKSKTKTKSEEPSQAHKQELTPETSPEPKTPAGDAGDDLETIDGDLGSAYTFETVPDGASYDYVIEYEQVAPGATHGPKTSKPVKPVRRTEKGSKEVKSPAKVKAKAKEAVAKSGRPVTTKESKRIEMPEGAETLTKGEGAAKKATTKIEKHIEPVTIKGGPHGEKSHVEPILVTKETKLVEKDIEPDESAVPETSIQPKDDESAVPETSIQPKDDEPAVPETSIQPKDDEPTVPETSVQPKDDEPVDESKGALDDPNAKKAQELLGNSSKQAKEAGANDEPLDAAPDSEALGAGVAAADTTNKAKDHQQEMIGSEEPWERETSLEAPGSVTLGQNPGEELIEAEAESGQDHEELAGHEELDGHEEVEGEAEQADYDMHSEVSSIKSPPVDYNKVPRVLTFPEVEKKKSRFSFKRQAPAPRPVNPLATPKEPELIVKTDREGFLSKAVYDKVKYENRRHEKWLVEFAKTEKVKCEQKQVEYDDKLASLRKKVEDLEVVMEEIRKDADKKLEIAHHDLTKKFFDETHEYIQLKNKIFLETKAIQEQREQETAEVKERQSDVQREIDALNSEKNTVQRDYISWSNRLADFSAHLDAKMANLHTIRVKYNSTQREIDELTQKKADLEKEMEDDNEKHAENTKIIQSHANKEYLPRIHEIDGKISALLNELSIIKQESANEKVKLGKITKDLENERIAHEEKLKLEAEERKRKEEDLLGKQREESEARAAEIKKQHEKELKKLKKSYEKQLKQLTEQQNKRDDDDGANGAAGDVNGGAHMKGTTDGPRAVSRGISKTLSKGNDSKHGALDSSAKTQLSATNGGPSAIANDKPTHNSNVGRPSMESSLFEYETEEEILPA